MIVTKAARKPAGPYDPGIPLHRCYRSTSSSVTRNDPIRWGVTAPPIPPPPIPPSQVTVWFRSQCASAVRTRVAYAGRIAHFADPPGRCFPSSPRSHPGRAFDTRAPAAACTWPAGPLRRFRPAPGHPSVATVPRSGQWQCFSEDGAAAVQAPPLIHASPPPGGAHTFRPPERAQRHLPLRVRRSLVGDRRQPLGQQDLGLDPKATAPACGSAPGGYGDPVPATRPGGGSPGGPPQ